MNQESVSVWDMRYLSSEEAYDQTQCDELIRTGDVLLVQEGIALMYMAWPVLVVGQAKGFHQTESWSSALEFMDLSYATDPAGDKARLREGLLVAWAIACG